MIMQVRGLLRDKATEELHGIPNSIGPRATRAVTDSD